MTHADLASQKLAALTRGRHRRDIQGLRALAVTLVVVFHLAPAAIPGGYIGVDIFFVISGFLITSHLLRESRATGTVVLSNFWARRIRRLLPASLFVLFIATLLTLWILPRTAILQNLKEITFAALYGVNWSLAADSVDYLAADHTAGIAQHYWSLSVEEQFYLVWPLLLVAALWIGKKLRIRRRELLFFGAIFIVLFLSFGYSIFETRNSQSSAYFVTTTRAWEFAAGAILAFVPSGVRLGMKLKAILAWVALATLVGCALKFGPETAFPGWVAFIPVLATAILIWLGDGDDPWSPQYVAGSGPIQYLGNISYSLYLWHWPLIIVFASIKGEPPTLKWAIALFAGSVVLAVITERFIERPFRVQRYKNARNGLTFCAAAVAMIAILAVTVPTSLTTTAENQDTTASYAIESLNSTGCFGAYSILNNCADPYRVTDSVNPSVSIDDGFGLKGTNDWGCTWQSIAGQVESFCEIDGEGSDSGVNVALLGDSHAEQYAPALEVIARDEGWAVSMRARAACTGVGAKYNGQNETERACSDWGQRAVAEIADDPSVDIVLITGRYEVKPNDQVALGEAISQLKSAGKSVAIIRDLPGAEHEWKVVDGIQTAPACVERSKIQDDPCAWAPTVRDEWVSDSAKASGAVVIDPWEIICESGRCHSVIGGLIVYTDSNHMTRTFARTLATWLREEIVAIPAEN